MTAPLLPLCIRCFAVLAVSTCPAALGRTLIAAGGAFGDENGLFTSPPKEGSHLDHLDSPLGANPPPQRAALALQFPQSQSQHGPNPMGSGSTPSPVLPFMSVLPPAAASVPQAKVERNGTTTPKPESSNSSSTSSTTTPGQKAGAEDGRRKTSGGTKTNGNNKRSDERSDEAEERRKEFFKKVHNVPIQEAHGMELAQRWADQAFSSLFAAVADNKLKGFAKPLHDEFGECSKQAKTVPLYAKCVSDLLNGRMSGAKIRQRGMHKSHRFDKYRMEKRAQFRHRTVAAQREADERRAKAKEDNEWIGSFRMMDSPPPTSGEDASSSPAEGHLHVPAGYAQSRRERRQTGIVKKNYYELLTPSAGKLSPLGKIAKMMLKGVLKSKGKEESDVTPWQKTVLRIKESANKRKEIKKRLEHDSVETLDQLTYRGLKKQGLVQEDLNDVMHDRKKLQQFLAKKKKETGGRLVDRLMNIMRDGLKLGYAFGGKNASELDDKTMRMVSPRFLSVTPDDEETKNETIDFLSPSLFSMHNMGNGIENLTSIPNMLKSVGGPLGFSAQDQQLWLDFIMEASNVTESEDLIEAELAMGDDPMKAIFSKRYDKDSYERETRTKDGTPLYFTKQNISDGFGQKATKGVDIFEQMLNLLSKEQVKTMNRTGYAMMTPEQLELVYASESEYQDEKALARFKSLNASTIQAHIERDIHTLALMKSFKITRREHPTATTTTAMGHPRSKRNTILSPVVGVPSVNTFITNSLVLLSPILFSPLILTPVVLGPVILSPWLFVPIILSPRLLAPVVLSPFAFAPVVLSPLALIPAVLSPGAFLPLVLSPLLMVPFILSPQVFSPAILSPVALSPGILTPTVGSPFILSPFVLSPAIYSPKWLTGVVLSPYALSPVVASPVTWAVVILSPSWLS